MKRNYFFQLFVVVLWVGAAICAIPSIRQVNAAAEKDGNGEKCFTEKEIEKISQILQKMNVEAPAPASSPASAPASASAQGIRIYLSSSCPICIQPYESDQMIMVLTSCGHAYHAGCVSGWLLINRNCPNCRRNVEVENGDCIKLYNTHKEQGTISVQRIFPVVIVVPIADAVAAPHDEDEDEELAMEVPTAAEVGSVIGGAIGGLVGGSAAFTISASLGTAFTLASGHVCGTVCAAACAALAPLTAIPDTVEQIVSTSPLLLPITIPLTPVIYVTNVAATVGLASPICYAAGMMAGSTVTGVLSAVCCVGSTAVGSVVGSVVGEFTGSLVGTLCGGVSSLLWGGDIVEEAAAP
ncbi:MAG: E3 ubiquitin protein ligase [Oligoflexia bacterium]|nr:E3 ubiquitin protein ligase [Oligoflexia bacterium]